MSDAGMPHGSLKATLVGREHELRVLRSFVDSSATDGAALLVLGEPGVGKTALLQAAAQAATSADARVLRAAGVEFETDVSFAGLNQVLLPLSNELSQLTSHYRQALSVALGLGDGPVAERLVVASAALALLKQATTERPLVLIVDDLQWLDRASALALGFVARCLAGTRIAFLAAQRSAEDTFFERADLPTLAVLPLSDEFAARLLSARFPALAPRVSQRVMQESRGIPLALLELPHELSQGQQSAQETLPQLLPLSRHLQAIFAFRVAALPAETRRLLLLAALDGSRGPADHADEPEPDPESRRARRSGGGRARAPGVGGPGRAPPVIQASPDPIGGRRAGDQRATPGRAPGPGRPVHR